MMRRQEAGQAPPFYAFNLKDQVPANHLLRGIDRFLDLSELHRHLVPHCGHTGRPSADPAFLIRMLIVGYCFGIPSERRLCDVGTPRSRSTDVRKVRRSDRRAIPRRTTP